MKISFYTLGCKVNQYETEAMRDQMEKAGFETDDLILGSTVSTDIIVINSCTVTGESDRKLRQLLRRCKRDYPDAILILTGCMPQAFPDEAEKLSDGDIILGNASRRSLSSFVSQYLTNHQRIVSVSPHDSAFEETPIGQFEGHTRAFVKIEDGCNRFCSYCIIPYARGRVRSRSLDDLKSEVTALAENGYKEIVLVGINLTAFGQDTGHTIADAIETVCAVDGIERVRLGSIEPDHLTPAIIDRMAGQKKLCPQFHLALQSGCDATLKRMRRQYTTDEYKTICQMLRERFPHCAITTDFMVGFPGETEEEFETSLQFVKDTALSRVHIFAYSRRAGTKAANAPDQVPNRVKTERSKRAAGVCNALQQEYANSLVGTTQQILLETPLENGDVYGYTPQYVGVRVKTQKTAGTIIPVTITAAENGECYGIAEKN